jgi:hypothetical protein
MPGALTPVALSLLLVGLAACGAYFDLTSAPGRTASTYTSGRAGLSTVGGGSTTVSGDTAGTEAPGSSVARPPLRS